MASYYPALEGWQSYGSCQSLAGVGFLSCLLTW